MDADFQVCSSNAILLENPSPDKRLFLEESNSLLAFPAHHIMSGLLKLRDVNVLSWMFFVTGDLPVHCGVFDYTLGFYPKSARSIPL